MMEVKDKDKEVTNYYAKSSMHFLTNIPKKVIHKLLTWLQNRTAFCSYSVVHPSGVTFQLSVDWMNVLHPGWLFQQQQVWHP